MSGRAQTPVDFAMGIGVFLLALAFVFAILPSVFAPFQGGTGELLVIADGSADRLATDLLVENPGAPATLNATCVAGFFDADGVAPSGCRYDDGADAADLRVALGIGKPGVSANVTIRDDAGIATVEGPGGGDVTLAAGRPPPSTVDVVVARRLSLLEGEEKRIIVRLW